MAKQFATTLEEVLVLRSRNLELRRALVKFCEDLDTADCGEGLSYNLRYIKKDLQKALLETRSWETE